MIYPLNVQKADQVAQQATATSSPNRPIQETQTYKFTWKINNFSSLGFKKIFSNSFEVGGYKWRVLLFPKGNRSDCLSMYLGVTDLATLPHGWRIDTQVKLALINQLRSKSSIRKGMLHILLIIHFRHLSKPTEDDFCLELSKKFDTYDNVVGRMAFRLGLDDPSKIRLTPQDCHSHQPKSDPIKYCGAQHLQYMLTHDNQTTEILYYEVLDIPLPQFKCLKTLKLAFCNPSNEVTMHEIKMFQQNNVGNLLDELKTRLFTRDENIGPLDDQECILRAEEIHEEEKNLDPPDRLIRVYHFKKEFEQDVMKIQNFGEPFILVVHEKETLAEIKVRIQKKLQVADEEFCEWKFAIMSMGRPEYLQDTVIIHNIFQEVDTCDDPEWYLGLEHLDTVPSKTYSEIAHKILQVNVLETLGHAEAKVEPVMELTVVPGIEKRKDHGPPKGPLSAHLAKKARVSTTDSHDSIVPLSTTQQPIKTKDHVPSIVSTATQSRGTNGYHDQGQVVSPTEPKSLLQSKDCIARAVQILEPHMSEDFARIDDQSPDVIVGESLKASLESFVGMHQAMQKYKIQLDSKSKKLEEFQVTNTSLSIAKAEAEDALKAAEEKASINEAESAALKTKLEEFQAKERSWEAQIKAQKVKFEAELSSALKALETVEASTKAKEDELAQEKASRVSEACCKKAREKALEEFGAEVGGLVNKYHLACHIRSLTLAGLEPKDPRWYDVSFPIEGPTPPLKFPWED